MPALARSMLPLFSLLYATFGCSDDSRSEKTHAATNHVIDAGPLGDHAAEGDTDAGDTDAGDTDAGDTDAGDTDAGDGDVGDDGEQVNEKDGGPGSRPGIDDGGVRPSDGGNGDGMNDATVESSPPGPLVCETAFPDYDCEFSRTAFRQTFDTLLQNECEDCHGTLGGTPPNLAFDAHDTLLPFINLEDVAASALIELIYGGHQCWQACDAAATEMRYLLEAWQWEFVLRERRLEELQDARERWAAANIDAYEWSIENGCFNCLHDELYNVTAVVQDGSVVALRTGPYAEEPVNQRPPEEAFSWHVVEGMFDVVERIIQGAPHGYDVVYDALGFVDHADIDPHRDWFDDEDYYYSGSFSRLGEGFCEASGPFLPSADEADAPRCSSTDDCDSCRPLEPEHFPCGNLERECSNDADCGNGLVCIRHDLQDVKGCYGYVRYCASTCADGVCPEGFECSNGQCKELPCWNYLAACEIEDDCQPQTGHTDRRGCRLPACDESGKECGALATCDPAAAHARLDGCAPIPCASDADCGCGSCVGGHCNVAPGVCAD